MLLTLALVGIILAPFVTGAVCVALVAMGYFLAESTLAVLYGLTYIFRFEKFRQFVKLVEEVYHGK